MGTSGSIPQKHGKKKARRITPRGLVKGGWKIGTDIPTIEFKASHKDNHYENVILRKLYRINIRIIPKTFTLIFVVVVFGMNLH